MRNGKRGVRTVYTRLLNDRNPYPLEILESLGYNYARINYNIIANPDSHNKFSQHCNQCFRYKHWVLINMINDPRVYFTYEDDRLLFMLTYGVT